MDNLLYDAYSHEPDPLRTHDMPWWILPETSEPRVGLQKVETQFSGLVESPEMKQYPYSFDVGKTKISRGLYSIAYTKWTPKNMYQISQADRLKPWVVFLHGVPTNRRQWYGVQKRVARFLPTISFDMLGMGDSSKPRFYGESEQVLQDAKQGKAVTYTTNDSWNWENDLIYIDKFLSSTLPIGSEFIFVADDWGGGQLAHFAANYNVLSNEQVLKGCCFLDPIAFDGYPVNEIQAIGRASKIIGDAQFAQAMGAFDQTVVQIYKTMVYDNTKVYNQYSLRDITFPYIDENYIQVAQNVPATSETMKLKMHAIRVLADRASVLGSSLLLPYHSKKNPSGVKYSKITVPVQVQWGAQDNMMPANQIYRYQYALQNTNVDIRRIQQAGHFAATDQPEEFTDNLLNWIKEYFGIGVMEPHLGFQGIFKGDEQMFYNDLLNILEK